MPVMSARFAMVGLLPEKLPAVAPYWFRCGGGGVGLVCLPFPRRWIQCLFASSTPRAGSPARSRPFESPASEARAAAVNAAIARGRGELVGFLEAGDQLAPHALFAVASSGVPDADLYYPDEDVLEGGRHLRPIFKPAWSAESLLSHDFVGGLKLLRRHLLERAGGLRDRDGAEEHDLLLRLLPELRKVHHLPDVLFHRRPDVAP